MGQDRRREAEGAGKVAGGKEMSAGRERGKVLVGEWGYVAA